MNPAVDVFDGVLHRPAHYQPPTPMAWGLNHLNIVIPSLAMGGAERAVLDVVYGLARSGGTGALYVLNELPTEFAVPDDPSFPRLSLAGLSPLDQMRTIATQVQCSPVPVLVCHLLRTAYLQALWRFGVQTIPVIHNLAMGWHDPVSNYDDPHVPFMVAVSADVKSQLCGSGSPKPVTVLRHEPQRWRSRFEFERDREEVRGRYAIGDKTRIIGMVGQFKAHKAYVRAVRIMSALRATRDVKLMIVGGWDHTWGSGRQAHEATVAQARELGVLDDVIFVGAVQDAMPYMCAFDVFLNTSIYEGLSVASLEAAQLGLPLVLADVGGQREIATDTPRVLIADPSDIPAYAKAIEGIWEGHEAAPSPPPRARHLVPQLWSLVAEQAAPAVPTAAVQTLFLTSNLNPGGAQRSLTNLLLHMPASHRIWLCVIDQVLDDTFVEALRRTPMGLSSISGTGNVIDRAHEILVLARRLGVRTMVFWNLDAELKLVLAKALEFDSMILVDVSPGPMLFEALDSAAVLQNRITLSAEGYLDRLDHFVAKYDEGLPGVGRAGRPRRVHVIPNGVPIPPEAPDAKRSVRPSTVDEQYAIVTCCRIVPDKMIETLVEVMGHVEQRLPAASLTVVGGLYARHLGYWEHVQDLLTASGITSIHFAGPCGEVFEFLDQFRVFVMLSRNQGCPNASLEAMAMGLPVVANPDGGTAAQVIHGTTGFLASADDPDRVADHLVTLLTDPDMCRRMGAAARTRVREHFSMERMVAGYMSIFDAESENRVGGCTVNTPLARPGAPIPPRRRR
jgi:glycosyltransferase involved in cell wall biosynthesis